MSEPVDKVSASDYAKPHIQKDVREVKHGAQGFVTYAIYVTLGAGLLFPWNAFITAADYFELEFPVSRIGVIEFLVCIAQLLIVADHYIASHYFNKRFHRFRAALFKRFETTSISCLPHLQGQHTDRLITVCYLPVTLAMLLLMIHYNDRTNIALRIVGGMAGFCISMIAVPVVSSCIVKT